MAVTNPELISDDYVWYYTAEKVDSNSPSYGTTESGKMVLVGENGNLDEEVGPFSLGYWNFTLYGFKKAEDSTLDKTKNISTTSYTFKGSANNALIVKQSTPQRVSVIISTAQTAEGKGTLVVDGDINLVDRNGNGYTSSDGNKLVVTSVTYRRIDTSGNDTVTMKKDSTSDDWTASLSSGTYEVVLTYSADESVTTDNGTSTENVVYAKSTIIVNIYDDLTTEVTGTLDEMTQTVIFNVTALINTVSKRIVETSELSSESGVKFTISPTTEIFSENDTLNLSYVASYAEPSFIDEGENAYVILSTYGSVDSAVLDSDSTTSSIKPMFVLSGSDSESSFTYGWDILFENIKTADNSYVLIKSYVGTGLTISSLSYLNDGSYTSSQLLRKLCTKS